MPTKRWQKAGLHWSDTFQKSAGRRQEEYRQPHSLRMERRQNSRPHERASAGQHLSGRLFRGSSVTWSQKCIRSVLHPSARPPQENRFTVSLAVRRESKLIQPFVRLLTIRAESLASLFLPAVMTSHFSLAVPEQLVSDTGMRLPRKSPAVGSTNRHSPLGARISTLVNALVALSSREFASAAAVSLNSPPRPAGISVVGMAVAMAVYEASYSLVNDDDVVGSVLASDPPKVNNWLGSRGSQSATSTTSPLAVRQDPTEFPG